MNSYLAKKLKLPEDKVPSCIENFGNTSSVSIPLTMVSQMKETLPKSNTLLLSGFGVGMSWATCVLNSPGIFVSEMVEV
jgi:3-oxoacyl-[acyl-carrier-protein] synthase-3